MQLIAYGILAQKLYEKRFELGFILYEEKGKTIPLHVNEDDKQILTCKVEEIHNMIERGKLPYSNADDGKCTQCEFENYCNDRF